MVCGEVFWLPAFSYRLRLPVTLEKRDSGILQLSYPVTAARPRWLCTNFPFPANSNAMTF